MENIPVITNISIEPFLSKKLSVLFGTECSSVVVCQIPYMEYRNYQELYREADIIFIWLNLECLIPGCEDGTLVPWERRISEIKQLYQELYCCISGVSQAKIVAALFEDYFSHLPIVMGGNNNSAVDELNMSLQESFSEHIVFIDFMYIIASVGISNAYSVKDKYRWNYPYSQQLTKAVAAELYKQYLICKGNTKKCVIVDCDNVLWGGILTEGGMESLRLGSSGLGKEYQDFQRFLLSLYRRGVLLAVCSKNDLDDVLQVFRGHSGMLLKEEHIVCFQVNWGNKPDNIARIAETLHIDLGSIVFVDDSPAEIEAVRSFLPEVVAIPYHRERMYEQFSCFHLKKEYGKDELAQRNETYRTDPYRQRLREESVSYSDYLTSLKMEMDIHKATPLEYMRIAELTQRTNKCTNGKRYSVTDIKRNMECLSVFLYSVHLLDRYSDLGLIGAVEVMGERLRLFSVSCRALGRGVEEQILDFVKQKHVIKEIDFITTNKNGYLIEFFREKFPQSIIVT